MPLVPIETQRLRLRALSPNDAGAVFGILGHDRTTAAVSWRQPTLAAATSWVERRCQNENESGYSMWGVERLSDDALVGVCGFFATSDPAELELGYVIHADYWGLGLATEAAQAAVGVMLDAGFKIVATIRPANIASIRVATKIGMTHDGQIEDERGPLEVFRLRED